MGGGGGGDSSSGSRSSGRGVCLRMSGVMRWVPLTIYFL